MTLTEVRVHNTELNTDYYFSVRQDRVNEFLAWAGSNSVPDLPVAKDWSEGVSGGACCGLISIFPQIPFRFPMADLLRYLSTLGDKSLTLEQVEYALERFALTTSTLTGDGNDV
jgi:hypothetical protein